MNKEELDNLLNSNKKFRLHVIGTYNTLLNNKYSWCSFTQKVINFCKMMKQRGHYIICYGVETSDKYGDLCCDEFVPVVSIENYNKCYKDRNINNIVYNYNDSCFNELVDNIQKEIEKKYQKNDIILPFFMINDLLPLLNKNYIIVNPSTVIDNNIYMNIKYQIFESNSCMHYCKGTSKVYNNDNFNFGNNIVINNFFDINDFIYSEEKNNYLLYLGKIDDYKGIDIILNLSNTLNYTIIIAGQINPIYLDVLKKYKNIKYIGVVNIEQRKKLLSKAKALIYPVKNQDSFGNSLIEAMLSGTPIITSNNGACVEINKVGYICENYDDYVKACLECIDENIDYKQYRNEGLKYSFDNTAPKYERFFNKIIENNDYYLNINTLKLLYDKINEKVTIGIPASRKSIVNTLQSINIQKNLKNIHVILALDNQDEKYFGNLKNQFPNMNIKILKYLGKNIGPGLNRQRCIDNCKTKYIMFIDDDDYFYDEYSVLKALNSIISENNNYCICTDTNTIIKDGNDYNLVNLNNGNFHSKIFNVKTLRKYNIKYDIKYKIYAEDVYFMNCIFAEEEYNNNLYIKMHNNPLYIYNYNDFSACRKNKKDVEPRNFINMSTSFVSSSYELTKRYKDIAPNRIKIYIDFVLNCKIIPYYNLIINQYKFDKLYKYNLNRLYKLIKKLSLDIEIKDENIKNLIDENYNISDKEIIEQFSDESKKDALNDGFIDKDYNIQFIDRKMEENFLKECK